MGRDVLETEDGAALATEILDMLESELVRFTHRLAHNHGVELDRARAAMVLLGKLVGSGVKWTAKPDSNPLLIYEAFRSLVPTHPDIKPELADTPIAPPPGGGTLAAVMLRYTLDMQFGRLSPTDASTKFVDEVKSNLQV
jgi:hypothetical protein